MEIVRRIVCTSVKQNKTKEIGSQNYADKKERGWKWYIALRMDGVYMDKQIGSCLVCTV